MKKIAFSLLCFLTCNLLLADEGMWMLNTLKKDNWSRMRELGFTLSPQQLYDVEKSSLKDAVVHFNGGCTGVTVSDKGLLFTNHHCGYGAIQSKSSVEHDYLKDGFIAQKQEDEIPIQGMFVRYLIRTEDVTQQVVSQLTGISNESERLRKIDDVCTAIEDSVSDKKQFIQASVSSYFSNNAFYLNVYEVYTDVRLAFAPPSSVGKFGGDTDNWMWPRQTGDFSVFRVYATKENKPAGYAPDNVPYKPKYVAPVSLKGYDKNDYCMTIGYPGRTYRYLSSWGVVQRVESSNEPRIEVRGIKQDILKKAMIASDAIRIKYASKYASSSNYWKNSIGMNRGIEKMDVVGRKQALEQRFENWINQDPARKSFYGEALDLIKKGYETTDESQKEMTYLSETLLGGAELVRLSLSVSNFKPGNQPEETEGKIDRQLLPAYKDYDASLDQQVLAAMLEVAKQRVSADKLPAVFRDIDKKYKGDYKKYAADVFKKSVVPYPEKMKNILMNPKKAKDLEKDPAVVFARSVRDCFDVMRSDTVQMNARLDIVQGERLFLAGLQQMMPEKDLSADANSTMRISYGSIGGYSPYDGAWYDYYTTTRGVFEKYKKDDPEFDIQPEILDLLHKKNFGLYANPEGDMNLCFLSNNDITGGNSGSPMFDGEGRLIGLAFDGNWEAMSGDIAFEPELQRTIGVDIRYVMFMIDKWGKCRRLVEEINAR